MTTYSGYCNQNVERNFYGTSGSLVQRLHRWFEILHIKAGVNRERRQLVAMSEVMLKDIGITRSQAIAESRRVDLPAGRLEGMVEMKC